MVMGVSGGVTVKSTTRFCRLHSVLLRVILVGFAIGFQAMPALATVSVEERDRPPAASASQAGDPLTTQAAPVAPAQVFGVEDPPFSRHVTISTRMADLGTAAVFGQEFADSTAGNPAARVKAFDAIFADQLFNEVLVVGIGLIFATIYVRRRRRRRIGWGVIPQRPPLLQRRSKHED
jgi:hypothetical protein